MIPLPEFVLELRRRLDEALIKLETAIVSGQALGESADQTAILYSAAIGRANGLRKAREIMEELVKQVNEGGL